MRALAKDDLYYLITEILSCKDWPHPEDESRSLWDSQWMFDRIREAQFDRVDKVWIWARSYGKSTIHTFAGLIHLILNDPNITIGIFSVNKERAEDFLEQIMTEFEDNELLRWLFDDVLWENPKTSPLWSKEKGIKVKRTRNWKNGTVEALGLVGGNYAGARFKIRHYDDVITEKEINTPDQILKAIKGFNLSQGTRVAGGWSQIVGTFYVEGDPYHNIVTRGYPLSLQPCYELDLEKTKFEDNGLPAEVHVHRDRPVLFSAKALAEAERDMQAEFPIQMLCDPHAGVQRGFKKEWIRYYTTDTVSEGRNKVRYILVDPSGYKRKDHAYTVMWVVGLGSDQNYYLLDGLRQRMELPDRARALIDLHRRWRPYDVRYETYGMQADISHIRFLQEQIHYRFDITPVGGAVQKDDRIARLIPSFRAQRWYFPVDLPQVADDGEDENLVQIFIKEEFTKWPNSEYKDMLDALARIEETTAVGGDELYLNWPSAGYMEPNTEDEFDRAMRRAVARQNDDAHWLSY